VTRPELDVELIANGRALDIRRGPTRITRKGIRGLGMPVIEYLTDEVGGLDGEVTYGYVVKPRTLFLPMRHYTRDVVGTQRQFWSQLLPMEPVTIRVGDGMGDYREVEALFVDDGGITVSTDPHVLSEEFGVTLKADRPMWLGKEVAIPLTIPVDQERSAFGQVAGDPPVTISSSYAQSATSFTNPGDVAVWGTLDIIGSDLAPVTAFRLEIDGHRVSGEVEVPFGHILRVETDPRRQLATLIGPRAGGDVTDLLVDVDFAPVRRGQTSAVSLELSGQGSAELRFRPAYFRAF
jgi:hypothetical protein